jgi:hypothetical protein
MKARLWPQSIETHRVPRTLLKDEGIKLSVTQ